MFSDTLVVASPVLEIGGDEETATGGLLVQAAWLQLNLAVKGFFLRGGLSLGPFHIREGLLFGPALVAAYELEQEAAVNPRIVLSDDFAKAQRDALAYYGEPRQSPQNMLLLVDQDERPFVNYLSLLLDDLDDPLVALAEHRDVVVGELDATHNDSRRWEKYRWVADYHNAFCGQAFLESNSSTSRRATVGSVPSPSD